jgi:trk system potassium uptake protein TrkA
MNIIIVGCGRVGQALAEKLNAEGNNVTVIDSCAEKVKALANKIDVMGVIGNGASHIIQKEAGIDSADLLIAVTGADELNLLACIIAKQAVGCHTIARVRDHVYYMDAPYLKDELGLAMVINPEQETAEEIARVLRFPSAISIETFAKGKVELLKFRIPDGSPIVGMSVRDVVQKYKCDLLFCTAERGDEAYIVKGNFVFEERDIISIIASPKNAQGFFAEIGYKTHSVKDAIIVGGGEVCHYLCSILENSGIKLRVIEKDKAVAERLSSEFPGVTVINADTADQEILNEEGIGKAGAFIALTDTDEENVILSLFARGRGSAKVVTKIKRIDYDDVIQKLDLDTVVYPKNITADKIVRYVRSTDNRRGSDMETLYNVIQDKIEAAEFKVAQNSAVVGIPLSELKLRENVLVSAILRDGRVIIPRGNDSILVGDSVVLVSEASELCDISDIIK